MCDETHFSKAWDSSRHTNGFCVTRNDAGASIESSIFRENIAFSVQTRTKKITNRTKQKMKQNKNQTKQKMKTKQKWNGNLCMTAIVWIVDVR